VRSSCFASLALPVHRDDVRDALRQVWAGEVPGTQLEAQFARPDGSARWLLLAVSPVIDSAGEISTLRFDPWISRFRIEAVADTPYGLDPMGVLGVGFDLPSYPAHDLGHRRRSLPLGGGTPHVAQQVFSGEHTAR
jgi:PAS domain-containing protein